MVGEPAEPVRGIGTLTRVGIGGNKNLIEQMDT
jgi:hypothetical protein